MLKLIAETMNMESNVAPAYLRLRLENEKKTIHEEAYLLTEGDKRDLASEIRVLHDKVDLFLDRCAPEDIGRALGTDTTPPKRRKKETS